MQKEMSLGEGLYKLMEIFMEIAAEQYKKTGKWNDEELGKFIKKNRKEYLVSNEKCPNE